MTSVRVGDHELFAERSGSGEPLLLIQGMSGTVLSWGEPFLAALGADFDVVRFDHRGVGRSRPKPADGFTLVDLAEDAAAVLDHAGLADAHVLGISMGGMVAQELALRHPDRVRTLVLGCTYAGGPGSVTTPPEVVRRLATSMGQGDREQALRAGFEVNVSEAFAADPETYAAFRAMATRHPAPIPTIVAQAQAIAGHDTSARLGGIRAPTLVVHGTEDRMLPVGNARHIADRIPGARVELLDGIGHMFWWEQPERSAALVREHALAGAAAGGTA